MSSIKIEIGNSVAIGKTPQDTLPHTRNARFPVFCSKNKLHNTSCKKRLKKRGLAGKRNRKGFSNAALAREEARDKPVGHLPKLPVLT
jgi:hypothetical protein